MARGLCEVLNDFGLVSFLPLNISDASTVVRVLGAVDRANGYAFAASEAKHQAEKTAEELEAEGRLNEVFRWATSDLETTFHRSIDVFERYNREIEEESKPSA